MLWRQQLALLAAGTVQPPGAPDVSMAWQSPSALGRTPCQVLIRQGGGYNERPASKAKLPLMFPRTSQARWGRWGSRPEGPVPFFFERAAIQRGNTRNRKQASRSVLVPTKTSLAFAESVKGARIAVVWQTRRAKIKRAALRCPLVALS